MNRNVSIGLAIAVLICGGLFLALRFGGEPDRMEFPSPEGPEGGPAVVDGSW